MPLYLPLTEYSSKYKVSVSTLRRRIRAEDIQYMFEDGRYLILDEPMSTHQRPLGPSQNQTSDGSLVGASSNPQGSTEKVEPHAEPSRPQQTHPILDHLKALKNLVIPETPAVETKPIDPPAATTSPQAPLASMQPKDPRDSLPFRTQIEEPILAAANRLLTELKKAYTQILQEKEEQILNLKDEVADLKTLVRVLESDNERLKKGSY